MSNKKKILIIVICIILVVALIIGGIVLYKINKNKNTQNDEPKPAAQTSSNNNTKSRSKRAKGTDSELEKVETTTTSKNKRFLEDYEIIGRLEIPKIELSCDILNEVTKRSIEIAVGQMYSTSRLNQPGNTVLYGHNYRNTLFFSRLDELVIGDKLYITDEEEGKRLTYEVYNIFETTSTDTSFYVRTADMTGGKAEVTLSTCTDDASQTDRRLIILAREIQ